MNPVSRKILFAAATAMALALALSAATQTGYLALPAPALRTMRWMAIAALAIFATKRRTLTAWIVVAMFAGGEVGHDFPSWAENLQVLSKIFLQLIKTII